MLNELRSQTKGLRVWRIRGRGFEMKSIALKKAYFYSFNIALKIEGEWKICVCIQHFDKHKKKIIVKHRKKKCLRNQICGKFLFVTFTFLVKSLCVNERWMIQQHAEWILIPKRSIAKKCCFHVFLIYHEFEWKMTK